MKRLAGKTTLIFGAGPNIGGTIAHVMAREGAVVAFMDVSETQTEATKTFLSARKYECHAMVGNALLEKDIRRAYDSTVERFKGVDIAVNLVGLAGGKCVSRTGLDEWNEHIAGSLTSGMLTSKYAMEAMAKQGRGGSIIHVLSTGAHYGHPANPAYCSAKAGLLNLSRAVAMEAAHLKIRCNTITPIGMEHNLWTVRKSAQTDARSSIGAKLSDALALDATFKPNREDEKTRYNYSIEDVLQNIPLGRLPRASDIAFAAVFLASDESEFITGIDIPIDGGVRARYPIWRPGDFSGITLESYLREISITQFGEPVGRFSE